MSIKDVKTENYTLLHGDCLERMKEIPDGSVDLILTDPPYGTTTCKWDSIIPLESMWKQLKRIIKPNGAIVLFGAEPFSSLLRVSNLKMYKYDWVWEKTKVSGFTNAKNKPLHTLENVIVFSFGITANTKNRHKKMVYYPQGLIRVDKQVKNSERSDDSTIGNRPSRQGSYVQEFSNYPKNILKFSSEKNTVHPTQKPVALMEYLIKTYTNENETVLDFTFGSGSTGVACLNTNRKFLGVEMNESYFNITKDRLETTLTNQE